MPDQQVPWALGRRALIMWRLFSGDDRHTFGWRMAIGALEDLSVEVGRHDPIWVLDPSNVVDPPPEQCVVEYKRLGEMERIHDSVVIATTFVPGQCPRCFESTRPHAPGCMVAANLARGVPAFWAPWAMRDFPASHNPSMAQILCLHTSGRVWHTYSLDRPLPNCFVIALGPNGPTLEPWGIL